MLCLLIMFIIKLLLCIHTDDFFLSPLLLLPPYPTLLLYRGITTNESDSISMFLSLRK